MNFRFFCLPLLDLPSFCSLWTASKAQKHFTSDEFCYCEEAKASNGENWTGINWKKKLFDPSRFCKSVDFMSTSQLFDSLTICCTLQLGKRACISHDKLSIQFLINALQNIRICGWFSSIWLYEAGKINRTVCNYPLEKIPSWAISATADSEEWNAENSRFVHYARSPAALDSTTISEQQKIASAAHNSKMILSPLACTIHLTN